MRHLPLIALMCVFLVDHGQAQEKKPLAANGWGSLSGKIVDAKGLPVANAVVYLQPHKGAFFPIHADDQKRNKHHVIEYTANGFEPKLAIHYPSYFDGKKQIATGERLLFKNTSGMNGCFRVIGAEGQGFNMTVLPNAEFKNEELANPLSPSRLPFEVRCDYRMFNASLFVLDHPYFAITNKNGDYAIPRVPAGAEVNVLAWEKNVGFVLLKVDNGKKVLGEKITFEKGKETKFDLKLKAKPDAK